MLAPIIVFAYNRPEHLRNTLKSLMANDLSDQSELFIYADGPKEGISAEGLEKIKKTREVIREKQWCGEVHIIEREKNMGLASSVIAGVTEVINKFGKVIVLEDDLEISPNFLKYINKALDYYSDNNEIMEISGYSYPTETKIDADAYFLPFISSLGWGTWKRVWDSFDKTTRGVEILKNNKKMRYSFDLDGSYPYYKMILGQEAGRIDSWAIRFCLSIFLQGGLVLYPKKTLIFHEGFDEAGTHCKIKFAQGEIDPNFLVEKFDEKRILPEIKYEVFAYLKKRSSFMKKIRNLSIKYLGI